MKSSQFFLLATTILLFSSEVQAQSNFKSVTIDTLLSEKISIRAIEIRDQFLFYAGNRSRFGSINLKTHEKKEIQITPDTLEFRSIAVTDSHIFIANVGSPAQIFRTDKNLQNLKTVYNEIHPKAFYDSMQFYDDQNGIAIGDPTNDCMSIVTTNDHGASWQKTDCEDLPKTFVGEAAFAASNTNVIIKNNKTWIVSGGQKARVFYSENQGKLWNVYETPIAQGSVMSGIFSADFYNEKIGFIAGGNYEKQTQNSDNKAITKDGGKTWKLVGQNNGPGYISCVQFVPNKNGKELVTVGALGLFYSADFGETWSQLYKSEALFTIRFIDENNAIAAGNNIILKLHFSN